ncbi:Highly acidic protein [hydrothermal vent metagenome]|uniref:Highly acidic protein n=1 Tax=hydrothermal vent metagenome TaxID=652676 RepID=A0A1W1BBD8_9ZZZZ
MKILLVNNNPVVSRLTALSARKESVKVDEIKDISELKNSDYDIVFVDLESYSDTLSKALSNSNIQKRVLFHTQNERDNPKIFNLSIIKPFLPSEVSTILRDTKMEIDEKANQMEEEEEYLNIDELVAEKKDDLAPMTIIEEEIIKNEEENLLAELNQSKDKINKITKSPDLEIKEPVLLVTEEKKDVNKLFEPDNDDKKSTPNTNELFELDKSNDLKDELLDFDLESKDEVSFDIPPKDEKIDEEITLEDITIPIAPKKDDNTKVVENLSDNEEIILENITTPTTPQKDDSTKILDQDEISNIKNLLNNDDKESDEEITLESIMTTTAPLVETPKKVKKKKKKKYKMVKKSEDSEKLSSELITETLSAMPIDDLRRLLLGTKIHITIEFPNEM